MKEPFLSLYRNDIPCLTDYTEHGKINIVDEHHRSLLHHAIKLGLKDAFFASHRLLYRFGYRG